MNSKLQDLVLEFQYYNEFLYTEPEINQLSEETMQNNAFTFLKSEYPTVCTHWMCKYLGSWYYSKIKGFKVHQDRWYFEMQDCMPVDPEMEHELSALAESDKELAEIRKQNYDGD